MVRKPSQHGDNKRVAEVRPLKEEADGDEEEEDPVEQFDRPRGQTDGDAGAENGAEEEA